MGVFVTFWDFWLQRTPKKVHCNEMDEDRPKQTANRNCYKLSRVL